MVIFAAPTEKFTKGEFDAMDEYLKSGGSILMMTDEGGEAKLGTNVNFFLEQFEISTESDAVVRTVYEKYLHPKECLVTNGVLNRALTTAAGKKPADPSKPSASTPANTLSFVLPYSCTLRVQKPAVAILSSGQIAYPLARPVAAVYDVKGGGRLCAIGSHKIFNDTYLAEQENVKLQEVLLKYLTGELELNQLDAAEPDYQDYFFVPDTESLADRVKCALQESEELPKDFSALFDDTLFKFDTKLIPEAIKLYEQLDVKHEPLTLIPPSFETPLPELLPAVFPCSLAEPPAPPLDLFDLDEMFASEKMRMAQLTNKCKEGKELHLDYFIQEAADVLGVASQLPDGQTGPKSVIEYIFKQVVHYKKLNQESAPTMEDGQA